uniref:G-protein coupled receptors family 1 profile domain-containing protein n=1 Tax=Panagrolaimus sp. PS1159 TaxID=55785 RepID=A0AC35FEW6_9BILA
MPLFDSLSTTPIPLATLFPHEMSSIASFSTNFSSTLSPVTTFPTVHPYIAYARKIYIWLVPVMVSVLTIAVIGNGLIVISAPWLSRPINPYHRLCVSLAAADTWAASLLVTGLIVNSYLPVVIGVHKKTECLAAFLEIFRISGMLTSNLHIFALAVHQFVGIVYPLRYKMILTTRRQRLLIFILWTVPLAFIFTWFIAIPNDGFRHPTCKLTFYGRLPFRLSVFIIGFLLNSTVNFLVMVKLLLNPLIYALRMKHIRKSVLACLRITCFCCFRHLKANSMTNLTTNNGLYSSVNEKAEKSDTQQSLQHHHHNQQQQQHKSVHRTTSDKICKPRRTSMCPRPLPKSALRSSSTAFETRPRGISQDDVQTIIRGEPDDSIQLLENISQQNSRNRGSFQQEFWHDTDSEA